MIILDAHTSMSVCPRCQNKWARSDYILKCERCNVVGYDRKPDHFWFLINNISGKSDKLYWFVELQSGLKSRSQYCTPNLKDIYLPLLHIDITAEQLKTYLVFQ